MPNYFKIGQENRWLRPASATCDFRISHGTANCARCTSPAALPWEVETNCVHFQILYKITETRRMHQISMFETQHYVKRNLDFFLRVMKGRTQLSQNLTNRNRSNASSI